MILVAVMAVLFVTLLIASSLINHFVVEESAAIERDLAESRVYWAQIGQLDYLLSRAMADGEGLIGFTSQGDLKTHLESYLGETPAFVYNDVDGGGSYTVEVVGSVTDLGVGGQMRIQLGIADPGTAVPAVAGLQLRASELVADVCIGDQAVATRSRGSACVTLFGVVGDDGLPTVLALQTVSP